MSGWCPSLFVCVVCGMAVVCAVLVHLSPVCVAYATYSRCVLLSTASCRVLCLAGCVV